MSGVEGLSGCQGEEFKEKKQEAASERGPSPSALLDFPHTGHKDLEASLRSRRAGNEAGVQLWAPDFSTEL